MNDPKLNLNLSPDPPEDKGGGGEETPPKKSEEPKPEDKGGGEEQSVPYSRFKEINDKKKELEDKLKEKEEAEEAARLKKAEEDGDLQKVNKELSDKVDKLKGKADKYDKLEQGIRDDALKTIADALGDEAAAPYADFGTEELQTVAKTMQTKAAPPAPDSSKPGGREVDETEAAALKKYGSKANIARLNPDLYRKLYPNPRRRRG